MSGPDWKNVLTDQIAARAKRPGRRSIAVNYPTSLYALVRDAAKARGMSMTAYQRRAALAFAVNDLGLKDLWADFMVEEPDVTPYGSTGGSPAAGFGPYGAWKILGLGLFS